LARKKIAAPAEVALSAIPAVPADADTLAQFPGRYACAQGIHDPDHFMARNAGILDAREKTFLGHGIAVAHAASLDLDPHRPGTGLREVAFHDFQRGTRTGDLSCSHFLHKINRLNG
jgi:hypothetical protein